MTIYNNSNQLSEIAILSRLRQLDPYAQAHGYALAILDMDFVVTGYSHLVDIDSVLTAEQIESLLGPQTAQETALLQALADAVTGFNALPNWATWTPAEAATNITGSILNGWEQAQVDAWIDQTVTNLAGARTALKQIASSMIAIRSILVNLAKTILFLRDYVIKLRR